MPKRTQGIPLQSGLTNLSGYEDFVLCEYIDERKEDSTGVFQTETLVSLFQVVRSLLVASWSCMKRAKFL